MANETGSQVTKRKGKQNEEKVENKKDEKVEQGGTVKKP